MVFGHHHSRRVGGKQECPPLTTKEKFKQLGIFIAIILSTFIASMTLIWFLSFRYNYGVEVGQHYRMEQVNPFDGAHEVGEVIAVSNGWAKVKYPHGEWVESCQGLGRSFIKLK